MKDFSRLGAALLVALSIVSCKSRNRSSDIDLQAGRDAAATPADATRNSGTGSVYRIARIDRETKTVTLRPVDPSMTVAIEARSQTPVLQAEILGFADLEHLVGGGKSAEEILAGMEEGGDVTLYRDVRGRLTRLSY